jgi:lipopolysaccharide/colanic/teichoic acid biosynthesis glycosyltransferase
MTNTNESPRTFKTGLSLRWVEAPPVVLSAEDDRHLYEWAKRAMDIVMAFTTLLLLSPFLLLIALLIKLHSEGPAIFVQERIGYDPRSRTVKRFKLYKFRSMRQNADPTAHRQYISNIIQESASPRGECAVLKMTDDHRITGLGRILRKASIDELPQLINVLKGDMSMVGPRPALPYEVEMYQPWHMLRLQARPGLTGWWQVKGRSRVSFDEMIRMDIFYIEHRSLWLDLKILLLTPLAVVSFKGAG